MSITEEFDRMARGWGSAGRSAAKVNIKSIHTFMLANLGCKPKEVWRAFPDLSLHQVRRAMRKIRDGKHLRRPRAGNTKAITKAERDTILELYLGGFEVEASMRARRHGLRPDYAYRLARERGAIPIFRWLRQEGDAA